jgi:L-ascorbate metabolism protein UlaG (beta-lactamase superfamily)
MRRWAPAFVVLIVSAFALPFSLAGGKEGGKDKPDGPLTISFHGQSFFVLTTAKGKKIAFDPHYILEYQLNEEEDAPKKNADIICVSHNHNDHTRVQVFDNFKKAKILTGLKGPSLKANWNAVDEEIDGIKIKTVGVFHDDQEGLLRGKNGVFVVEVDGWRICHLGDLGHILSPAQVKRIGPVDVLMIPVGGIYTLNGADAKKVADQIKPKEYILPMHYGTKVFDPVLTAEEFMEQYPKRQVAMSDDNVLTLNKDAARPRPLLAHLHYWPKEEKKKDEKKKDEKKK